MLRWFLAICILSNLTHSYKYQYSREKPDNDNTHNGDKEEIIEELKQKRHADTDAKNIASRRVWEHFMETLNTHENALRMGKAKPLNRHQVSSETTKDRTKNVNNNTKKRKWNNFLETLKTQEKLLRNGNIGKDSNELDKVPSRRNLVDWFKNIFYPTERTTEGSTTEFKVYPTILYSAGNGKLMANSGQKAYDNSNPTKYMIDTIATVAEAKPTASIDQNLSSNLTLMITKLVQVLDIFNERLKARSQNKTYFIMEMTSPVEVKSKNETNSNKGDLVAENKILRHNDDVIYNAIKDKYIRTAKKYDLQNEYRQNRIKRNANVSQKPVESNVENTTNYIEYLYKNNKVNNTEDKNTSFNETKDATNNHDVPLNLLNTRRFNGPYNIRTKLLAYLKDIFEEITIKLKPAATVKKVFSNDVSFKIGYITANLNNLQSNIARLRSNMDTYGFTWNEHEIFKVFDILKMYQNVVLKLVDSLSFHLRKVMRV